MCTWVKTEKLLKLPH